VVHFVNERLLAFVAWHGEIPPEARRVEDYRAREHAVDWIRKNIGIGIVHTYVIGFELGAQWWTLFAERVDRAAPSGAECWHIEAYDDRGCTWSRQYFFWPADRRWRHVLYLHNGDDSGRHPALQIDPDPLAGKRSGSLPRSISPK